MVVCFVGTPSHAYAVNLYGNLYAALTHVVPTAVFQSDGIVDCRTACPFVHVLAYLPILGV